MSRVITSSSTYSDRLLRLIPAEMISAYIAIQDLVLDAPRYKDILLLTSAAVILIALPFYLWFVQSVRSKFQIVFTMLSFCVWVFSVGGRYIDPISTDSVWRSAVLILWTTLIPIFYSQSSLNKSSEEQQIQSPNNNI